MRIISWTSNYALTFSLIIMTNQFIPALGHPINPYYYYYQPPLTQDQLTYQDYDPGFNHEASPKDDISDANHHQEFGGDSDYYYNEHNSIDSSYNYEEEDVATALGSGLTLLAALGIGWLGFQVADELKERTMTKFFCSSFMDEIDNDADGTNVDDGIDDGVVVGGGDGDGGVVVGGGDGGVDVGVGGGDGDGGVVVGGGDGDGGVIVGGGDGDGGVDEGGVGGDGGVIAGGGDGDGDGVDGGVGAGDGGVDDGIGNVVIEDGAGGRIKQENRRAAKFGGLDNENEIAIDYQANVINDDKIEKEDVHLGAGVENEIEVNKSGEEIVEKDIKGEEQSQDNVASRTPRRLNFLRRGIYKPFHNQKYLSREKRYAGNVFGSLWFYEIPERMMYGDSYYRKDKKLKVDFILKPKRKIKWVGRLCPANKRNDEHGRFR